MKPKELRGQMRQIVKELFIELTTTELYTKLQEENKKQLEHIHKLVKDTLQRIDDRQKDVQSMVLRELSKSSVPSDKA